MADDVTTEIWKFFSPSYQLWLLNQITILYMSQWLRYHSMCKIVSWFDDNLTLRSSKYFHKIGLWTHKLLVKWILKHTYLWSLTTPVLHLRFGNEGRQLPPSSFIFISFISFYFYLFIFLSLFIYLFIHSFIYFYSFLFFYFFIYLFIYFFFFLGGGG